MNVKVIQCGKELEVNQNHEVLLLILLTSVIGHDLAALARA